MVNCVQVASEPDFDDLHGNSDVPRGDPHGNSDVPRRDPHGTCDNLIFFGDEWELAIDNVDIVDLEDGTVDGDL